MSSARLLDLLAALAHASDLSAALAPDTSLRTAMIAVSLGRAHGLDDGQLRDVLVASLLRHIGCTSSAFEEVALMGDEMELRSSMALVDAGSPAEMFSGARRGFARDKGVLTRARRVAGFMARAPSAVPKVFAGRCEVSLRFAKRLQLAPGVARALDETYERHDGRGVPLGLSGPALSPLASILGCAEVASLFVVLPGGDALALEMVERRAGGQLAPDVVESFRANAQAIFPTARAEGLWQRVLDAEPQPVQVVDDDVHADFATVLADVADLKSPFTLGHSRGVARLASSAVAELGLDASQQARVSEAALLHDVGRISVSNAVWDKPGPLDAAEWEKVRLHPVYTERIVRSCGRWSRLAPLASSDHQRPGSSGYPLGTPPTEHSDALMAKVLAVADVYQALIEPRAHRAARDASHAAEELEREVATAGLDRQAAAAVLRAAGHVRLAPMAARVAPTAASQLTDRELEVIRLLARGLVDKEIAVELGISPRTVHHHNQHIYDKIGVRTRSGVALFVVENGLL